MSWSSKTTSYSLLTVPQQNTVSSNVFVKTPWAQGASCTGQELSGEHVPAVGRLNLTWKTHVKLINDIKNGTQIQKQGVLTATTHILARRTYGSNSQFTVTGLRREQFLQVILVDNSFFSKYRKSVSVIREHRAAWQEQSVSVLERSLPRFLSVPRTRYRNALVDRPSI